MKENWAPIPKSKDEVYQMKNENGGNVAKHLIHFYKLKKWGGVVELNGHMDSAAVIFIHLPNARISKNLRIRYHMVSTRNKFLDIVMYPIRRVLTLLMASTMSENIKREFLKTWSHIPWSEPLFELSAKNAKIMDPSIQFIEDFKKP